MSFSQVRNPSFFRLDTVAFLWDPPLPVRNTTLIPRDNNFLYSLRLSGSAGALAWRTQELNSVALYFPVLKFVNELHKRYLSMRKETAKIVAI